MSLFVQCTDASRIPRPTPLLNCINPTIRYRKWQLNEDEEVDIIVRCEVDAAIKVKDEDQLLSVKTLNETDLRTQVWTVRGI